LRNFKVFSFSGSYQDFGNLNFSGNFVFSRKYLYFRIFFSEISIFSKQNPFFAKNFFDKSTFWEICGNFLKFKGHTIFPKILISAGTFRFFRTFWVFREILVFRENLFLSKFLFFYFESFGSFQKISSFSIKLQIQDISSISANVTIFREFFNFFDFRWKSALILHKCKYTLRLFLCFKFTEILERQKKICNFARQLGIKKF